MRNATFIVSGFNAAIIDAEQHVPSVRPGGKVIEALPTIDWEDAPEEMRNDSNRIWITTERETLGHRRIRLHTEKYWLKENGHLR